MNNSANKKFLPIFLFLIIFPIILFVFFPSELFFSNPKEKIGNSTEMVSETIGAGDTTETIGVADDANANATNTTNAVDVTEAADAVETIKVEFTVADQRYEISIPENFSIYEAMEVLATTADFSFEAKYYSGLGYFIEQINDLENAGGAYWTLYVNDAYSPVGVSGYKLRAGDHVEWKFEKKS